jgi:excisionase family DNA binding protein
MMNDTPQDIPITLANLSNENPIPLGGDQSYGALPSREGEALQEPLSLLTAREAAKYLRVSLSTLYRMEQVGQLIPLRTPGGHRRYTLPMLNACLANASRPSPAAS